MSAEQDFIFDLADKISMPDVYFQVRKLMDMPEPKIEDFESFIQADSMLALRLVKIANSKFFDFERKADTLHEAISLIGFIQLHDLLLISLAMRIFYTIPSQLLNKEAFWRHSIKCGITACKIAKYCRIPARNRFFALGLLLEIGHAVMYIKAPEQTVDALVASQQENRFLVDVEREYFGFDYCQLGAALMRLWQLPEVYPHIVENHLYPERTEIDYHIQTDVVNLAHQMLETPGCLGARLNQMLAYHHQTLDIPENIEAIILEEIARQVDDVFALLSPPENVSDDLSIKATFR